MTAANPRAPRWKDLGYTLLVILSATLALVWPAPFVRLGGFPMKTLIKPLLMVIMFGIGTAMSARDFVGVLRMPRMVLIGLCAHFSIMPLTALAIAKLFGFPSEIAAGLVLMGSTPCGLSSNVMSYIARANVALSITMTAVATLLSPLMTPLLMRVLASQFIPINGVAMMLDILQMTIAPIAAGLVFNHFIHGRFAWLDRAMPRLSMAGIIVIIAIITAGGRDQLLTIGPLLVVAVALHNVGGYALGYAAARLCKLDRRSCRTVSMEVGMQNGGLATGIALGMGKIATVGLAPAVFASLQNVTGSALANWWRRSADVDDNDGAAST